MSRRHIVAAFVGAGIGVVAGTSPALAADRAYELVTPPGSTSRALPGTGMATPNGEVVCFDAEDAAGGANPNGTIAPDGYCAWRTRSGWETKWVTGPAVTEPRGGYGSAVYFVSPDANRVAFATDKGIYPDFGGAEPGGITPSTQSAHLWEGGDMPRWLAPTPEPLRDPNGDRNPLAASDDLTHGLFQSGLSLLPADTNGDVDVYEWTPDGIRLVSRDATGAAVGGTVPLATELIGATSTVAQPRAMSRDGSRVFFQHVGPLVGGEPDIFQSVFLRQGNELRHISKRGGGDAPNDVLFGGASGDGSVAYLQSAERLTPDPKQPGTALYRYDVASDTLSLAATDPLEASFLGVSDDGSTLVYRSGGLIGPWELRVLRNGVTTTLGTLEFDDVWGGNTVGSATYATRGLRISRDGRIVVFSSLGSFDAPASGRRQVYLWTPGGGVRRISAAPGGAAPTVDADVGNYSYSFGTVPRNVGIANTLRGNPNLGRALAEDGTAFFETAEQLVRADVNEYIDVYEWHNGALQLVSPGTQRAHAFYHDNSEDGSTAFFTTSARVIPELDRNESSDLYAARVGGGFKLPERQPACEGDRCQGTPAPQLTPPSPTTGTFRGPGDSREPEPPLARHRVLRFSARQRRAFARRGQIVMRVRANAGGVVTATARARFGRRTVRVASSTAGVRGGATARLPLSLSRRARSVLGAGRRLRVVIDVTFSESDTTVRRVVVLRG
jgi:hypothetical protein